MIIEQPCLLLKHLITPRMIAPIGPARNVTFFMIMRGLAMLLKHLITALMIAPIVRTRSEVFYDC